MRITKKMYEKHILKVEKEYQKCPKCNRKRNHIIGIHTFQCECGEREWYPERLGDENFTADWGEVIKQM